MTKIKTDQTQSETQKTKTKKSQHNLEAQEELTVEVNQQYNYCVSWMDPTQHH